MKPQSCDIATPQRDAIPLAIQWLLSIGLCLFVLGYVLVCRLVAQEIPTWGLDGYVVTLLLACLLVALLQWRFQEHRRRASAELKLLAEKHGGVLMLCSYCGKVQNQKQWFTPKLYGMTIDRAGVPLKHAICPDCEPKMIMALEQGEFFPEKFVD